MTKGCVAKGRDAAAVERLFRLVGLPDLDFMDIQMQILNMPVNFIYHKKGLKSSGLQQFEGDLHKAMASIRRSWGWTKISGDICWKS